MSDEQMNEKMDMIEECLKYMERVVYQADSFCASIRKKERIAEIVQLSEGIMTVLQIAQYTESVTGIKIDEENIAGFIADMTDGMENGDFNLVADIVEYELKPLYKEWIEAFSKVLDNE